MKARLQRKLMEKRMQKMQALEIDALGTICDATFATMTEKNRMKASIAMQEHFRAHSEKKDKVTLTSEVYDKHLEFLRKGEPSCLYFGDCHCIDEEDCQCLKAYNVLKDGNTIMRITSTGKEQLVSKMEDESNLNIVGNVNGMKYYMEK